MSTYRTKIRISARNHHITSQARMRGLAAAAASLVRGSNCRVYDKTTFDKAPLKQNPSWQALFVCSFKNRLH